jgi:hypothetical protein
MKNLLVSFGLFGILFVSGLFVFQQTSEAQNNLTAGLLELPAPPAAEFVKRSEVRKRAEDFYDRTIRRRRRICRRNSRLLEKSKHSFSKYEIQLKTFGRALEVILTKSRKSRRCFRSF